MARSEIRGSVDPSWKSRITLRAIRATLAAAISGRTQNKDSFDALKFMSRKGFLHFAQCALLRDLIRRSMLQPGIIARAAHSRAAETRTNTQVSLACDERKCAATFLLTGVAFL
jgi:hypothetical protein